MWQQLLKRLDVYSGLRATRAEWVNRMGGTLSPFMDTYLVITGDEATAVPCRQKPSCGGMHEVRPLSGRRLIAVCTDKDRPCSSFQIEPDDLAVFRFDFDRLAADIAEALTIEVNIETARLRPVLQKLGIAPHADWPVFIGIPIRPADSTRLVETAAQETSEHDGRILLLPTAERLDADTRRIAQALKVRLGFLDDLLSYDEQRGWLAESELEDAFPTTARTTAASKKLRMPPGTDWSNIIVTLMRNDRISIAHKSGNPNRAYTLGELNFETQAGNRNKAWDAFEEAVSVGCIPINSARGKRDDTARNRAREITECLQRALSIATPAFQESESPLNDSPQQTRIRGFWPLFKLRHEQDRFIPPLGNYPSSPEDIPDES